MDEYTRTNSYNQYITHVNDDITKPYRNIYMFTRHLRTNQSNRSKSQRRRKKKRKTNTHNKTQGFKVKPIFRYSRVYKRSKEYRRLVKICHSKQKNKFQYSNEVSKNHIIDKPKILNGNNVTSNVCKKDAVKRLSVISKWYNKFPIIKNKRDHSITIYKQPNIVKEQHKPMLIESNTGLDVMFNASLLIDVLSCTLCKGLYYNAHTIKECMHTFCKSCLILSTFENGPVCPICFVPFGSDMKEGIEYDHNIQAIVDKVFPRFVESEQKEIQQLDKMFGISGSVENLQNLTNDNKKYNPYDIPKKKEVVAKPSSKIVNSTSEFLREAIRKYDKISALFDSILCLALIHESDNMFYGLFSNVRHYIDGYMGNRYSESSRKYPRRFICVPKTVYVSHLTEYLVKELLLDHNYNIVFFLNNSVLSKNHTVEFICKSRRIDMSKCVIFRYKITLNSHCLTHVR